MSTRRDDKSRGRAVRGRGFSIESLERRELLTAASQTFTGPSLTALLTEAKHGQNTAPAVITKMVTALRSQLESGPFADLSSNLVSNNGFIVEAQNLELSFEQDLITQKLAGAFPKIDIDQLLRLQGQNVVAGLESDIQQASIGLLAGSSLDSSIQSTIGSLTAGPIHAIGTASSVPASLSKSFQAELNLLSSGLANGTYTLYQVDTTISAEAEAYRGEIHAALQVSDPKVSGHADTRINALENSLNAIAQSAPSSASTQVATAIKTFFASVLDTTGLFGSKGEFSKGPKNVTSHPLATLGQDPSVITNVSGSTGNDGTATLTGTLTLPNGAPIMGQNVAFTLDGAFAGVATTNFLGVATLPEVTSTDAPGTDTSGVFARFASNTNFLASYSTGNLTVNAVTTAVSGVSGSGVYGGTDTLTATLTNLATNQGFAGQTVSFAVDGTTIGTAVTDSAGVATLSGVKTTDAVGTDTGGIVASYAGSNSFASSSNEGNLVVSQAGTTLSAVSGTAGIGGTATLTATLTSNVTGQGASNETVNFTLDGKSVGTGTTNASGVATLTGVSTSDALGTDTGGIVATFTGDTNYAAASTATGNLVVSLNSTTVGSISGAATIGGSAALTATLTNGSTGLPISGKTLSFTLDGKSVGTAVTSSLGVATINGVATSDSIGVDTNGLVVSFAGDSTDAASTGTGNLVVSQAGTTLATSGSAVVGGSATLTATLLSAVTNQGISGQTISFNVDGKLFGTGVTNSAGVATVTGVATQSAGTDSGGVVASFGGSLDYGTSTATGNLVVAANASTLSNASGNVSFGGTATLTATLTDTKTSAGISGQSVSFSLDGKSVGTATTNSSGLATLAGVATTDAVGTDHNGVIATFAGNTTYGSSTSTGDLNVLQAGTTLGAVSGSSLFGGTATLTATLLSAVTSQPLSGQTVTFKLDGTAVGTAVTNASGVATLNNVATSKPVGTDTGGVIATFAGGTDYSSTTGTGNLVVSGDSTTITSVSGTASFGGKATLTAKMTNPVNNQGIAGKTIAFSLDSGLVGTAVTDANGVATLNNVTTTQAVGTDTGGVVAKFAGDSSYAASNGTGSLVVSKAATSFTSVSGSDVFGQPASLTATLLSSVTSLGIANQTVTFKLDGTTVGTATTNASGVATLPSVSTTDAVGTDTGGVVVNYAGSSSYVASQGTGDLIITGGTG